MQKLVSYFDVTWNRNESSGRIDLTFDDRTCAELIELSLQELSVICNILRSEKNVYYDAALEELTTIKEPVADTA